MKKLLLLLSLSLCLTSCVSAQVEQVPIYKKVATVTDIIGDRAILSAGRFSNYNVPAEEGLIKNWEYVFWMEIVDNGDQPTKKAVIVKKALTTGQATKNQDAAAKELSNRRIIQ